MPVFRKKVHQDREKNRKRNKQDRRCNAEMRIRNIPENLHKKFKMLCVDEGISINEKIIRLVKEAVEKWDQRG